MHAYELKYKKGVNLLSKHLLLVTLLTIML